MGSVQACDPTTVADWDSRLASFSEATFFHTRAWAEVLKEAYGAKPMYFCSSDSDQCRVILPMMEIDSWLTGRRGVGLPFTDQMEPLFLTPADFCRASAAMQQIGQGRRWKYYEIRGGRHLMPSAPPSTRYFGHTLALRADEPAQFSLCRSETRRAVRKAQRSGVVVEIVQTPEAMREFYNLLCQTRQRLGVPPQPFSFFARIQQRVMARNHGSIVLANWRGRPIAGAVFFHFGKHVLYKFGASDSHHQELRGSNAVMWAGIEHYRRLGFTTLDFGRTSTANEGLRRFKASWGAEERPLDYYRYRFAKASFVGGAADRSSGLHTRLFQHMPQMISRTVGAAIYRHLD